MCHRRSVVWCVVAECQSCGHMAESLLFMLHLRTLDTAHWTLDLRTLDLRTLDTEHYILDTAQTPSQMGVAQVEWDGLDRWMDHRVVWGIEHLMVLIINTTVTTHIEETLYITQKYACDQCEKIKCNIVKFEMCCTVVRCRWRGLNKCCFYPVWNDLNDARNSSPNLLSIDIIAPRRQSLTNSYHPLVIYLKWCLEHFSNPKFQHR